MSRNIVKSASVTISNGHYAILYTTIHVEDHHVGSKVVWSKLKELDIRAQVLDIPLNVQTYWKPYPLVCVKSNVLIFLF